MAIEIERAGKKRIVIGCRQGGTPRHRLSVDIGQGI
jgi:hypothetical protein